MLLLWPHLKHSNRPIFALHSATYFATTDYNNYVLLRKGIQHPYNSTPTRFYSQALKRNLVSAGCLQ